MVSGIADLGAEAILLAGAGRAILLQLAEPGVGRGVAEHSTFTDRPINRLKGTLTYVYAVVYGTDEQVKEVRRRVNRAHAPVRRAADDESPGYNAYDAGELCSQYRHNLDPEPAIRALKVEVVGHASAFITNPHGKRFPG